MSTHSKVTGIASNSATVSAGGVPSLDQVQLQLADEMDFWSEDDLINGPIGLLDELTNGLIEGEQNSIREVWERPLPPGIVPRPLLEQRVLRELETHRRIVLKGPAGSGKSFFLRELFARSAAVRSKYPRFVFIECAALRTRSAHVFEREACRSLFGTDNDSFRRFEKSDKWTHTGAMLAASLRRKLNRGGVLIFDHAEYLDRGKEISRLLSKQVLRAADECGAAVVFCSRDLGTKEWAPVLAKLPRVSVSNLGRGELQTWFEQANFERHREKGLTGARLHRVTGGSPYLVRDFVAWVKQTNAIGLRALFEFTTWRLNQGYMVDCARLFSAARRQPSMLYYGLGRLTRFGVCDPHFEPPTDVDGLLASGAMRRSGDGQLQFTSPLHAERCSYLARPANLARLLLGGDMYRLNRSGELSKLNELAELASDPIGRSIAAERDPREGLKRLRTALNHWGIKASMYIRDRDNGRLWFGTEDDKEIWPLSAQEKPDFARAAQTGQTIVGDDDKIYVPLTGNSGLVELVVVGSFFARLAEHERLIEIDKFAGVLRHLRSELAHVIERLALRRERRFRQRMVHRTRTFDDVDKSLPIAGVLQEAGCSAVAVFERSPNEWLLVRCDRITLPRTRVQEPSSVFSDPGWAEGSCTVRLDAIAAHPSGRGIVLSAKDIPFTFPRLVQNDTKSRHALYLRPVWMHKARVCRIVMFAFDGRASQELYGQLQYRLSVIAPGVVAASG